MKKTRKQASTTRPVARATERSVIRYPTLAGAVGLALLSGGCQEAPNEPPAATLAPLGQPPDTGGGSTPAGLTLPGTGGWGSLAAGGGGAGTPEAKTDPDAGATPCDPNAPTTDADGGADAGRHVRPTHSTPTTPGRMPLVRPVHPAGTPPAVSPEFDL